MFSTYLSIYFYLCSSLTTITFEIGSLQGSSLLEHLYLLFCCNASASLLRIPSLHEPRKLLVVVQLVSLDDSLIVHRSPTPDLAVSMPWLVASTDSASHSSYLVVETQIPATFKSMLFQPRSGKECLRNRGYHHTTAMILQMHIPGCVHVQAFTTETQISCISFRGL